MALGKGLGALLGGYTPEENSVNTISIYLIDNNSEQPRREFDERKLSELAASIREHGIVQPIIVKKTGERYRIIAGERRFRAAKMAGLNEVPAIIRDMNEQEMGGDCPYREPAKGRSEPDGGSCGDKKADGRI